MTPAKKKKAVAKPAKVAPARKTAPAKAAKAVKPVKPAAKKAAKPAKPAPKAVKAAPKKAAPKKAANKSTPPAKMTKPKTTPKSKAPAKPAAKAKPAPKAKSAPKPAKPAKLEAAAAPAKPKTAALKNLTKAGKAVASVAKAAAAKAAGKKVGKPAPAAPAPTVEEAAKPSKAEMLAKLLALRAQAAKESGREAVKSARLDKTTAMPTSVAKAAEFAETRKISAFLKKQEEPDDTPAPVKKKKLRKPPYTRTELKELRQILENERQRLIRDMGTMQDLTTSNEGGTSRTFSNHQADAATDSSALETLFVTRRYEEERLGQVVRALERLDEGTYGLCDMCEDEPQKLCQSCPYIPIGRLRAKPFAKLCIPCREQAEKRNKR